MLGIKTALSGPKRKILSRSYFLVLLKKKIDELTNEIVKFREEKDKKKTDIEAHKKLTEKNEDLSKEVRGLEGNLADYNLAFDKQRAGAKSDDLLNVQEHLAFQNQKLRAKVDAIFIERKNYEDKIISVEEQIKELKNFAEIKINELKPEEKEEYMKLKVQVKEANHSNKLREKKLQEISRNVMDQESKLRLDMDRITMFKLKEDLRIFKEKEKKSQSNLKDCSLGFEDLRKKLMEDVKINKKVVQSLTKRHKELKKLSRATYKKLQKIDEVINGDGSMKDEEKQKYEILYQKEQEIKNFLEKTEKLYEERLKEIETLEKTNLALLLSISNNKNLIKNKPKKDELQEMSKEYKYKKFQTENSEQTLQRVQNELIRRQDDLKKVDEIEETLPKRIKELEGLFSTLKEEIEYFEKRDEEKDKITRAIDNIKSKIRMINNNKEDVDLKYKEAEMDYRGKLKQLQSHPNFKEFITKEKELSQINQLKFGIGNYIKVKQNEANYHEAVKDLEKITEQINIMLCESQK